LLNRRDLNPYCYSITIEAILESQIDAVYVRRKELVDTYQSSKIELMPLLECALIILIGGEGIGLKKSEKARKSRKKNKLPDGKHQSWDR
jgi:hypothetical protein